MVKLLFILFIISSVQLFGQTDYLGLKAGLVEMDIIGDAIGYNVELNYEKELFDKFNIGFAFGVANQDNFPDYLSPTQQLFSGVPSDADMVIRNLSFDQFFGFYFDQNSINYLGVHLSYRLLKVFGFSLYLQPGINIVDIQTASFNIDQAQFNNGKIETYTVAYRVENFLSTAWSAEINIQKQVLVKMCLLAYARFTQHVHLKDFKPDYTLYGLGIKRKIVW